MDDRISELLLASLQAGRDLAPAARACGVSLSQAAAWSASPAGQNAISSLRQLARARSSLVLLKARADAARALVKLARDQNAKETARKACVDLLRLDDSVSPSPPADAPAPIDDADQRAWLDALERLGQPAPPPPALDQLEPDPQPCPEVDS